MRKTITPWQMMAIGLAVAILGLQITIGLEYLASASPATKASIVLAMISLAILPKLIEIAAGARMYALAAALLLAFSAWFAYSLPATVGRTGETRETRAETAKATRESHKLLLAELESARRRLEDASREAAARCRNPASANCQAARLTETERAARVDLLLAEVVTAPATPGDVASDLLAWALAPLGLTAEAIRRVSVLAFALGLDVIIWALVWFGTSDRLRTRSGHQPASATVDAAAVSSPRPPDGGRTVPRALTDEESLEDIRREVAAGRHHGVVEYGVRWGVSKGEASKRIASFEEDGAIVCQGRGRRKLVIGIRRRLKAVS